MIFTRPQPKFDNFKSTHSGDIPYFNLTRKSMVKELKSIY
jgi:hypothetical protein